MPSKQTKLLYHYTLFTATVSFGINTQRVNKNCTHLIIIATTLSISNQFSQFRPTYNKRSDKIVKNVMH